MMISFKDKKIIHSQTGGGFFKALIKLIKNLFKK